MTGTFMTQRSLTILISLILIVLGVSAVLLCKCTTLFDGTGLPRGLVYSWYEEGPLTSGKVMPFNRLVVVHAPAITFVRFEGKLFTNVCGDHPFIETVRNTPLRAFISSDVNHRKLIHIVDLNKLSIASIGTDDWELQTLGSDCGSRIIPDGDEVEVLDNVGTLLKWRHRDRYGNTTAVLDLKMKRIIDVKPDD